MLRDTRICARLGLSVKPKSNAANPKSTHGGHMPKTTPTPPLCVGVEEAARLIGVGPAFAWRELIGRGRLRSFKVGTRRLVPMDAIREFIAEKLAVDAEDRAA